MGGLGQGARSSMANFSGYLPELYMGLSSLLVTSSAAFSPCSA